MEIRWQAKARYGFNHFPKAYRRTVTLTLKIPFASMKHKTLGTSLAILVCQLAQAQQSTPLWEIGGQLGTLVYQGDLSYNPVGSYDYLKPSWTLYGSRQLDGQLSARLQLSRGRTGQDEASYAYTNPIWKTHRGLAFNTRITELAALLEYRPLGWNAEGRERKLNPYLLGGLGLAFTQVRRSAAFDTAYFGGQKSVVDGLVADLSQPTPRALLSLPVGLGMSLLVSDRWVLRGEAVYRFSTNDYLDGFSRAANGSSKDAWYTVQVGVGYRFSKDRYRCPSVL